MYKSGSNHTIVKGDTLWDIATVVYGSGQKYNIIWDANKSHMRSNDPNKIYPGEVIWIPYNPDTSSSYEGWSLRETGRGKGSVKKNRDGFSLSIDGVAFDSVEASFLTTLDTPADGWVATVRFDPNDKQQVDKLAPYRYNTCKVYLDGTYMGDTVLYDTEMDWNTTKSVAKLSGYSAIADIIDSTPNSAKQGNNTTLQDWIKKLVEPFGLGVEYEPKEDAIIKRIKIDKTVTVMEHISKWVTDRGYLLSNTRSGALRIYEIDRDKFDISGNFTETGSTTLVGGSITYSGRDRFRKTIAYSSRPKKHSSQTYVVPHIKRNRTLAITCDGKNDDDITDALSMAVRSSLKNALDISLVVRGWYNEDNILWDRGQYVTVQSPRWFLSKETLLIIKSVEFHISANNRSVTLTLCTPSVYIRGEVIDQWNTLK